MSSRRSTVGGAAPSEADLTRRRRRLHQSGALISSRSVASRPDVQSDFDVVDVGHGRRATPVEHLLARLEQHGLRRRLLAEDDAASYAVDVMARLDEEAHPELDPDGDADTAILPSSSTSTASSSIGTAASHCTDQRHAATREAHYYLCVPCELRLTGIIRHPPAWCDLENAHFHFSSAAHRAAASWMADEDIDETLHTTPLVAPTHYYTRIYVNGVPTLLSRRPGGGDMFYPLPHELGLLAPATSPSDRVAAGTDNFHAQRPLSRAPSHSSMEGSGNAVHRLFPPAALRGAQGGLPALWHRPLPSVYTRQFQLMRRTRAANDVELPDVDHKYRLYCSVVRLMVSVDHIDIDDYRASTWLPLDAVPLLPAVYRLRQERVPKPLLARLPPRADRIYVPRFPEAAQAARAAAAPDVPHRRVYTQPYRPIAHGSGDYARQGGDVAAAAPVPLTVFEDECYRVALVSAAEARQHLEDVPPQSNPARTSSRNGSVSPPGAAAEEAASASQPVLTLELLKQHAQSTSQGWQSPAGEGSASAVGSPYDPSSTSLSCRRQRTPSGSGSQQRSGRIASASSRTSATTSPPSSRDSPSRPLKRVKPERS